MDVVASVSAVLSVAEIGIQTSLKLATFAGQVKSSPGTISGIAKDMALMANILQQLGELMKQRVPPSPSQKKTEATWSGNETSTGISLFSESGIQTAMELAKHSRELFDKVEQELKKASKQISQKGLNQREPIKLTPTERLKWPFFQPRIEEIRTNMKDVQASLTLLLQITMLSYSRMVAERRTNPNDTGGTNVIVISQEERVALIRSIIAAQKENASRVSDAMQSDNDLNGTGNTDRGPPPTYDGHEIDATGTNIDILTDASDLHTAANPTLPPVSTEQSTASPTSKGLEVWSLFPSIHMTESATHSFYHRRMCSPLEKEILQNQLLKWRQEAETSLYDQWASLTTSEQTAISSVGLPVIWIHTEEPKSFINGLPEVKERTVHFIAKATYESPTELPSQPSEWQRSSENQAEPIAAATERTLATPFSEMIPIETRTFETVHSIQDSAPRRTMEAQTDVIVVTEPDEQEDDNEDWKMVNDLVAKYTNMSPDTSLLRGE